MGKAFSRYFTQIPWENIGPLSATAAPSLKVKKDFQRIYEFQAEPERQTKPSIYICEQVRAKNSEILSSQTSLPRQEMEILKFKKHNLRCSQRFGGRRENGWCQKKKNKAEPRLSSSRRPASTYASPSTSPSSTFSPSSSAISTRSHRRHRKDLELCLPWLLPLLC